MATPNIVPRADQEGGLGTSTKSWGNLFIEHPSSGADNAAVTISNLDVDQVALDINANNTTAHVLDITADAVTTGNVINISSDGLSSGSAIQIEDAGSDASERGVVDIAQTHASAKYAYPIRIDCNGAQNAIKIAHDFANTATSTVAGYSYIFNKTGASTSGNNIYGFLTNMTADEATAGANNVYGISCTVTNTHAHDSGTPITYGGNFAAVGSTNGTSTTYGIKADAHSADTNYAAWLRGADGVMISNLTTSSATQGGKLMLSSNDGAVMANGHRLGAIEFKGAEDTSSTLTVGARIEALCDATWSDTENGADLLFYTTNGDASQTERMRITADGEVVLPSTTKLSFHDETGGENIVASSDGHLEINAGTTLDATAPTIDLNCATILNVDAGSTRFRSTTSGKPIIQLLSTNTTQDTSSEIRFQKDAADVADGENLGFISFYGDNDAGTPEEIEYGQIVGEIADMTDGAEGGKITMNVATHDGELQPGLIIADGDAEDEVDVTVGNGTSSLTTIAGDLNVTTNIKFTTNSLDHLLQQHDGEEVARIHDGGTAQVTNMTAVSSGFGFKQPIMAVTADSGDVSVTLTHASSGSIIQCDADTNSISFILPAIDQARKQGATYTFVCQTAVNGSKTITIRTSGTDGNDKFMMFGFNAATPYADVAGDTLTIPSSSVIGTTVKVTCISSGASNAAEIWLVESHGSPAVTNA